MFLGYKVEHYCLKWPPGKVTFWEFYHSGSLLCDQKLTQKALILSIWELRNESLVHVNHPWKCLICSLFCVESGQIYTWQKLFTQSVVSVTHIRYGSIEYDLLKVGSGVFKHSANFLVTNQKLGRKCPKCPCVHFNQCFRCGSISSTNPCQSVVFWHFCRIFCAFWVGYIIYFLNSWSFETFPRSLLV